MAPWKSRNLQKKSHVARSWSSPPRLRDCFPSSIIPTLPSAIASLSALISVLPWAIASAPRFVSPASPPDCSSSENKIIGLEDGDGDFMVFISIFRFNANWHFVSFRYFRFRLFDFVVLFGRHRFDYVSKFMCNVLLPLLIFSLFPSVSVRVILLLVLCQRVVSNFDRMSSSFFFVSSHGWAIA
jgi:hypothetical protein